MRQPTYLEKIWIIIQLKVCHGILLNNVKDFEQFLARMDTA